jgi:class 3 adenylate cyclase
MMGGRSAIRLTIGVKIFSIGAGLLILMGAVAWINLRMTRTVDAQLVVIDENYVPAVLTLAQAHIYKLEESSASRRLVAALLDQDKSDPDYAHDVEKLRRRVAEAGNSANERLAEARRNINDQINDWLDFDDNVALARLDTHVEFLQQIRQRYEAILAKWVAAAEAGHRTEADRFRIALDEWRDDWDRRMESARQEMRNIARDAILGTRAYQQRIVGIGLALLVIAGLIGAIVTAGVTKGMVRPVRRLLAGTAAVEQGALDTVVPVTSQDEIGRLTQSFNNMVGELRVKEQIRETFGKYVDPRIVGALIDRPELTDPKGARRQMTILFCDMKGFTSFSEGMTPVGLVNVLNRYLSVISEPVRRNNGIIDKYIGDAVMAYWGPPFTGIEDQARLACMAAIEQLVALPLFQAELPDLMGVRRGLPQVSIRVGIATGEVVVGSIGSEQTRSYTVIGDTVNFASRLEGAGKAYGTHVLISEATQRLAVGAVETREIDTVLVVGKTEPERIFELLGRKGEVPAAKLELRDSFEAALVSYRAQAWEEAEAGFRKCLEIEPEDGPSGVFLARVAHFREHPPAPGWNGVWALETK